MNKNNKVSIVMGSQSDYKTMKLAENILKKIGVQYETKIISAHRTPKKVVNSGVPVREACVVWPKYSQKSQKITYESKGRGTEREGTSEWGDNRPSHLALPAEQPVAWPRPRTRWASQS